jgi:CDP-6-deoxy-D-xylo-4-hexulose-3-dehydrase
MDVIVDLARRHDLYLVRIDVLVIVAPRELAELPPDRLPGFIAARRRNFERLYTALARHADRLILPTRDARSEPSWFGFALTVRDGVSRAALVQWLETANIETRQLFAGNILRQPGYRDIAHRVHGTLERSDRVMRDTFFVGVYPGLTDAMVDFVAERIGDFFRQGGG